MQNFLTRPILSRSSHVLSLPVVPGDLTFSKNNPEENKETTSTCRWMGDPAPIVIWYKDGEALNEAELLGHIRITQHVEEGVQVSELQILSVELGDTGDYTCNVSNPIGSDFQVKRLEVRGVCRHCVFTVF